MTSATTPDSSVRDQAQDTTGSDPEPRRARGRFPNGIFPLGYKEGFSQWWQALSPAAAEAAVLSFLPFHHPSPAISTADPHTKATAIPPEADPYGPRECTSTLVPLSGKDRAINEFTITRTAEPTPENHLVMLHGYGAGLAFFYRNYDALSRVPGWKLWSLDLLGYGRSSRPPFVIKSKDPEAKITEAEDWFIDALEEWRMIRGIERFTLLGHSFGGYLSVRYCLKYPDRVNKLILASPVGVPEDPYAVRQDLPDGQSKNGPSDPEQAQTDDTARPEGQRPRRDSAQRTLEALQSSAGSPAQSPPKRPYPKWLVYLWEANVSPFSLVRWSGPLGPRLVSGWTSRRFSMLPPEESQALHDYSYALFRQRGSGEYALAYVLAPGAYARRPLIWRVQDLVSKAARGGIPSVWMYGELDWMDVAGGYAAEEKIRNTPINTDGSGPRNTYIGGPEWRGNKRGEGGEAKVLIVRNAGHHLYLEGRDEFNSMIIEEMRDVEERERRRKQSMQAAQQG